MDSLEQETDRTEPTRTLAIDIGGSGIKAIVLDSAGEPVTERGRILTPHPATPEAVLDVIGQLAADQGPFDRVSIGFPGVIHRGVTTTAHNLDPSWIGFDLASGASSRLGKPARVANDADIQGFGAISGRDVELVLTLGTGLGSALFVDGKLVPNLELAHHPFRCDGKSVETYEENLGAAARVQHGKKEWNRRLLQAIEKLDHCFNYDRLYLGGGNSKKIHADLPENVHTVANRAGLLGGIALWREP